MTKKNAKRWRATVRMKKPWSDEWGPKAFDGHMKKPTLDDVLERFGNHVVDKSLDDFFEVVIEEIAE